MTKRSFNSQDSGEKLDLLLRKVAALENMILIGDKVYVKERETEGGIALLQGRLASKKPDVLAGETFALEVEIANFGEVPATLEGIEEILPCCGIELVRAPEGCVVDGSYLDLNERILKSSTSEKLLLSVRAFEKGLYVIAPRIIYLNGTGVPKTLSLNPITIEVKEVVLTGRVSSGYRDLDIMLFGGLPERYAVVLTSISYDETKLLINRFIEEGARGGEITVLITVEAERWKRLAEECPNFNLFICNPQAESSMESLPNVVKIRGVENLTDVSIPVFSTLRKFDAVNNKPRRICVEILSDILLQHRAVQTRKWLIGLISKLKSKGFTTLAVVNPMMHSTEDVQAILDLFDGEISVFEKANARLLQVKRMYEQDYIGEEIPIRKDKLSTAGVARRLMYHNY